MSTFQTDKTTIDEKQISLHLQLKDLKKKNTSWWLQFTLDDDEEYKRMQVWG